jgi:hypothetical protein
VKGAVYQFAVSTGQLVRKIVVDDPPEYGFGRELALHADRLLVGAPTLDAVASTAYLFDLTTGLRIATLAPSDGFVDLTFGSGVALAGERAYIGASGDDDAGSWSGSLYVFDATQALAIPYCFGDGSGLTCPCGNEGAPNRGCANSASSAGASLRSTGSPCVSSDDVVLLAEGSVPGQPGLFFQGNNALNGGAGQVFGDGLRCAGGSVLRLEPTAANDLGQAETSVALAAAGALSAGDVRRYQWWYRDPSSGSPCGSSFNLSNGVEVIWGP